MDINQNRTLLINCEEKEMKIVDLEKLKTIKTIENEIKINIIRMYYKSNLFFIISEDLTKVVLYDDKTKKYLDIIKLDENIKDIKISDKYIGILTESRIVLYTLENTKDTMKEIKIVNTDIFLLSNKYVMYVDINNIICIYDIKNNITKKLYGHDNNIKNIETNVDEKLIATVSQKGTIIRVFDIETLVKVHEFRRGAYCSNINSINFNKDSTYLAVISDKITVHIYNLKNKELNRKSCLSYLGGYFKSDWSFAWYYNDEPHETLKCFFNNDNDLILVKKDVLFTKLRFDCDNGGECVNVPLL